MRYRLRVQNQDISVADVGLARRNEGAARPAYEKDQGVCGKRKLRQRFVHPWMVPADPDFAELHAAFVRIGRTVQDDGVIRRDERASVGNQRLPIPQHHDGQHILRDGDILEGMADPGMSLGETDLGQMDGLVFLIVVKGLEDIVGGTDYFQLLRHPWKQRALNGHRQEADAEHDMKDVVFHGGRTQDRGDGKDDGGGSPQAGPGDQQLLAEGYFKGPQYDVDGRGPRDQKHEGHNADGRDQYGNDPGRKTQEPQQEKQNNLHHSGDAVKKVDEFHFSFYLAVAQDNTGDIDA